MSKQYKILIMGASYGSLLGIKLGLAGHAVHLICLPAEADLINTEGAIVRMPIKGREGLVEINSRKIPGRMDAGGVQSAAPGDFDLVVLAMQEPQYRSPGVRELLVAVADAHVPCMSIMNMPPPPYLTRIPHVDASGCRDCYTDFALWDRFDPRLVTLCSPDPQAFRPPDQKVNVLQVRLPTNFKAARFDSPEHTAMLRQLSADVDAVRFDAGGSVIELPVRLKVHDSVFVPLAKWSMLIAGNYRCVGSEAALSIRDAVHGDLAQSRDVYNWVSQLVVKLGAAPDDLVPFDKYANAALSLTSPSSAARALFAGAKDIERVDRLVQRIAAQNGAQSDVLDRTVALVDARLAKNRQGA